MVCCQVIGPLSTKKSDRIGFYLEVDMGNSKLLHCPFCGGDAVEYGTYQWHFVRCSECDAESSGCDNEEGAVEQWNTRYVAPGSP
jgi:Lar family restriction alleviation protein